MIVINLLPARGKTLKNVSIGISGLLLLMLFVQLILVEESHRLSEKILYLQSSISSDDIHRAVALENMDVTNLQKEVEKLTRELADLQEEINLLECNLPIGRWIDVLSDITNLLPESVWLTRLETTQEDTLLLEGKGLVCDSILLWVENLQRHPQIGRSQVRYLQIQQEIRFGVELWWDGDEICLD